MREKGGWREGGRLRYRRGDRNLVHPHGVECVVSGRKEKNRERERAKRAGREREREGARESEKGGGVCVDKVRTICRER